MQIQYQIKKIHISLIRAGDTVEHNGKLYTVGRDDIKQGFMGVTIFGDSYRSGTMSVKLAKIFHAA